MFIKSIITIFKVKSQDVQPKNVKKSSNLNQNETKSLPELQRKIDISVENVWLLSQLN